MLNKFPKNVCLASYRGSVSYNTYVSGLSKDIDLLGIHFWPAKNYVGLEKKEDACESFIGEYDVVSYEFKKAIKMLLKANPNLFPILFIKDDHYLYKNFYGRAIVDYRDLFVSKQVCNSFYNFAISELKKLKKGCICKNPPQTCGYNTKQAFNCIRLLRMGHEFMKTGELKVYRDTDAQELMDIKLGKFKFEEIKEMANDLIHRFEKDYKNCSLPQDPETEKVHKLVEEIMYDYICSNRS